ncbi:MAG TPA: L,D-transpeptidase family protein [Allosphingosinicella sp.]|nr:L,D-transpeptidase family protein [Allosphingosinicella sp.]
MIKSFKRALCAAAALTLTPAAAFAATEASTAATASVASAHAELLRAADVPDQGRYVVVDAASARLFMIEDGEVQDSMRVIVGKPSAATPALKSTLQVATVNPYWNVPTDLAQSIIAPRVLKEGTSYLRERGYEVLSSFDEGKVIPAGSVDWKAVADGKAVVHVRQLPGPANSMGRIKIGVANTDGIFLHDTPNKELFAEADRSLSNGCVRLEDAQRLARWLLGRDPALRSSKPEQHVSLAAPVPIVITYLDKGSQMQMASLR